MGARGSDVSKARKLGPDAPVRFKRRAGRKEGRGKAPGDVRGGEERVKGTRNAVKQN